jgi:hypothetical protein
MDFSTGFQLKEMNILTNPISNVPQLKNSHVLGWSQVWADQLDAVIDHKCSPNIANGLVVYIEHGVNFGGTLNLFGGATKEIYDRINRVAAHSNVVSLDFDMPAWGEQLRKRIGAPTTYSGITEQWCDALTQRLSTVRSLKQQELLKVSKKLDGITVGDSHSPAFSRATDIVLRENGKTLYGTLKRGLITEFRGLNPFGAVTFCYGSIDVRHHILRHTNFNLDDMLDEYVRQAVMIQKEYECDISFTAPVPVEYEERRLPKTGYFKGTPFFGTRQQRLDLTYQIIEGLNKRKVNVIMPPEEWYKMDGEKYATTYMENSSSVHISPQYYRRKDWGTTCLA